MRFQYEAKQREGGPTTGIIEAASLADARQQLRTQGVFITQLSALNGKLGTASANRRSGLFRRVKKSDLVTITSQLTIMCQSGLDLAEAIRNVAQQCPKPTLKAVLEKVHDEVSSGKSFSESLQRHPQVFDATYVASVAAGEHSGTLTMVLQRMSHLMRGDLRLMNAVWSMLMYPIVLAAVTFLVLNALIFFVLPQFATVFTSLGRPAPPLTQAMLSLGSFVREHALLVVGSAALTISAVYASRNTDLVRKRCDRAMLNLALVRGATRALLTGRAFRLLGTMLVSGVPLVEGIRLCQRSTRNYLFRELFEEVEREVLQGGGLGRPFLASRFLPAGAAQMVLTAEKSGKMGEILQNVGEYFEDEGERHLRNVVKIAEPAVVVVLGLIVAGIVLSVVVPMLDVSTMTE